MMPPSYDKHPEVGHDDPTSETSFRSTWVALALLVAVVLAVVLLLSLTGGSPADQPSSTIPEAPATQ